MVGFRPRRLGPAMAAFVALLVAVGGAVRADDSPVGRTIAEVIPVNNVAHPTPHILAKMSSKAGKAYDPGVAADDVARLVATGWFKPNGVELKTAVGSDGKVILFVHVAELQNKVQEIVFVGLEHYRESDFLDLIRPKKGSTLNPAQNRQGAAAIAAKMRDDGRYYATCTLTEGGAPSDTRVVYRIDEGPKVRIGGVQFRGNSESKFETNSGRLKTVATARGPFLGTPTLLTPTFTPAVIDTDRRALLFHYQRLGYLDVQVDAEVRPTGDDLSAVQIIYHISEGKPYTVRQVRLDGNSIYPETRLKKAIELKANKLYDESVVQADAQRLTTLYGNGGYQVRVDHGVFAVPDQPNVVDVQYRVLEPQAEKVKDGTAATRGQAPGPDRVGLIRIEGNTITQERVIRNQLGLYPGQVLEYPKLREAEENLRRLNLFDMEDPPTVEVAANQFDGQFKDVVVKVKETRTGMFGVQAAVNSNAGLNGTISANQRNFDLFRFPQSADELFNGTAFRGGGQELRAQAMPGTQFQRYELSWREPYLFDSRFGLSNSLYYTSQAFNEYSLDRYGMRTSLDYRFDDSPIWRASGSMRVEGINVHGLPFNVPNAISQDFGRHFLMGFRGGLNRDTRDSFLMPSSGSVLDVGVEQAVGDYQFTQATAEFTKFWTVHQARDGGWKGVLALRSQLVASTDDTPVFERVFAGGFRSLRGFAFRGVGPYETNTALPAWQQGLYNVGGNFAFLNTIEYQIPLVANERLRLVGFCDHGTVNKNFSLDDYRVTVGLGLRIQVDALGPLPIALDFGFPIRKGKFDQEQMFSFYVGWIGGQ